MKLKNSFFYTLREDVKDEESISGNLLVRAGFIKKTSAGVYMMMPLGYRVQEKIISIIRQEMENAGAQEVRMPSLISEDVYVASGRRAGFGSSMFSLKDRFNKPYVLGPTHEELFAVAAQMKIKSYKDLPFNLYQFQTKFRDEPRPRYGLIRVREFIMKDAYSFDVDEKGLDISYKKMFDAYKNSFDRMNINYRIVKADTGIMGGLLSEEFQAITPIGEDSVVYCDDCGYSSNDEIAQLIVNIKEDNEEKLEKQLVETPHSKTVEQVCTLLNLDVKKSIKALLMNINNELVVFFVRGDRELNETKVCKLLGCTEVNFADDALIATSNAVPGFTGPVGLNAKIVVDNEVMAMKNFCCGANKEGYHYINVNPDDFTPTIVGDISKVQANDLCPNCGKPLQLTKGIEVGNTFKLGTKYSKAMNLHYLDQNNTYQDVWMGSYGIGPARCMGAIVEQNNDEHGIIWPLSVAPYTVCIVLISNKDEQQVKVANELYDTLQAKGYDVLLDDRDERPGVKFKDMDLIGIPYRITVGKAIVNHQVEFKKRDQSDSINIDIDEVENYLK